VRERDNMKRKDVGMLCDIAWFCLVLVHWLIISCVVDACTESVDVRKSVSIWFFLFALAINGINITRSWMFLGTHDTPPETLIGLFFEIINLTHVFGSLFAVARYFSLESTHPVFNMSLVELQFDSYIEMALVSAGVGFVSATPTTTFEKMVVWLAAYIGGVLCTSMFLSGVVLSRRAFWETSSNPIVPASFTALRT
jgi:hypothetical protein